MLFPRAGRSSRVGHDLSGLQSSKFTRTNVEPFAEC